MQSTTGFPSTLTIDGITYTVTTSSTPALTTGENNVMIDAGRTSAVSLGTTATPAGAELNLAFSGSTTAAGANQSTITIGSGAVTPTITVAAGQDVDYWSINSTASGTSSAITMNVGNGALIGQFGGSGAADTISLGDNVTLNGFMETRGGNDVITIGDSFTNLYNASGLRGVYMGDGADTLNLGDQFYSSTPPYSNFYFSGGNRSGGSDVPTSNVINIADTDDAIALDQAWDASTPGGVFIYESSYFYKFGTANIAPCFTPGTMIRTPIGDVAIETLSVGDHVMTRDHGARPLRWIGQRTLSAEELAEAPHLAPIRIRRGALGADLPAADLTVSPQHRILVRSSIAQRMFGAEEVLVAAKQLCGIDGIAPVAACEPVTYIHLLFDDHEVIYSNGAETESLYTGPQALAALGPAAAEEIFAIFPELRHRDNAPSPARDLASGRMGRQLAERHARNDKPLVI